MIGKISTVIWLIATPPTPSHLLTRPRPLIRFVGSRLGRTELAAVHDLPSAHALIVTPTITESPSTFWGLPGTEARKDTQCMLIVESLLACSILRRFRWRI